jgi:protein-L-isoaspartate(D-aspartate) O-methyltransferase
MKPGRSRLALLAGALLGLAPANCPAPPGERDFSRQRERMVDEQIRARGVSDARVLRAMRAVERHRFVPESQRAQAYADRALPIGSDQTISQPYVVAAMTELARVGARDRVLEIGTGSGYQAAVLAELADRVYTIEIVPELAERARTTLEALGYANVTVRTGDGTRGWPAHAPFDAIVVTAAPREVPPALLEQLAPDGRLVIPVGEEDEQFLEVWQRTESGMRRSRKFPVRFVPMTGETQEER